MRQQQGRPPGNVQSARDLVESIEVPGRQIVELVIAGNQNLPPGGGPEALKPTARQAADRDIPQETMASAGSTTRSHPSNRASSISSGERKGRPKTLSTSTCPR